MPRDPRSSYHAYATIQDGGRMFAVYHAIEAHHDAIADALIARARRDSEKLSELPVFEQRRLLEAVIDGFAEYLITKEAPKLGHALRDVLRHHPKAGLLPAEVVALLLRIPDALREVRPAIGEDDLTVAETDALGAVDALMGRLPSDLSSSGS